MKAILAAHETDQEGRDAQATEAHARIDDVQPAPHGADLATNMLWVADQLDLRWA
jgi:hypothetical protein